MRDAFVEELLAAARQDPDVMLVVGDLGYGVVDEFAQELPAQFLNAGVAEQNMVGAAAGLAASGFRVFVYSIANFPTFRALEQVRNDVCYHGLDVTIVSVGAGVAYGTLGYTHHAVEDLAIMRSLPGLRIIGPADPMEARTSVREALTHRGPTYIRLGKNGEPTLHAEPPESLQRVIRLREGDDVTLVGTGAVVWECLAAAEILEERDISCEVLSCPTVKPFDTEWLTGRIPGGLVVTVEEHVLPGGFGSAVLECVNDLGVRLAVLRVGLREDQLSTIGSGQYLRARHQLDGTAIAATIVARITGA